MSEQAAGTTYSVRAIVGFCVGLLVLPGLPALWLGLQGLREINASDGRIRGRFFAVGALVLGSAGVVLSLAGLLALILFPIRAASDRVRCQNHLRQLGFMLNLYYEKEKAYPRATLPQKPLPFEQRLSWYLYLLPLSGQEALYERFDRSVGWDTEVNRRAASTQVPWFQCPACMEMAPAGSPALTQYVGMAGVGGDAPLLPADNRCAGVFGYDRRTKREEITGGISYTMMVLETAAENGPWAAGGPSTLRSVDPARQPYVGPGRPFGGLHRGGLNILFVDGAVPFYSDTVDPQVFERLAVIGRDKP